MRNVVLLLVSLVVAVGLAEVVLRVAGPRPRYEMRGSTLELDPQVLFRLVASEDGTVNREGYRDVEHPADSGRDRVLVVGDSYVMGYNVALEETLPRALGRLLEDAEVRNHGVYGYGPDQTYLRLRDEGLALAPRTVVLVLFPANDFHDLAKNGLLEPGEAGIAFRDDNPVAEAMKGSRFVALVRRGVRGSMLPADVEESLFFRLFADAYDLGLDASAPEVRWKLLAMGQLLTAYRGLAAEHGFDLRVVLVPSWEGVNDLEWFPSQGIPVAARFVHEDRAVAICEAVGLEFLDLRQTFAGLDTDALYDPEDHHFSAEGNRVVAAAIAEWLGSR